MNAVSPHAPYIDAVVAELTTATMKPEQTAVFVEDSYDVPFLRGVVTLTPETSGIPANRYPHGLILVWDWHTGRNGDHELGPVWQWARLNDDGSCSFPYEQLPVPGWVSPAALASAVATLAHSGTATPMKGTWHAHKLAPVQAAIDAWTRS